MLPRLADDPVRVPQRVGAQLRGVVIVVRRAPPRRLPGVGLHQRAPGVDPHELPVSADRDRGAEVRMGHRVEGSAVADMMVRVDLVLTPLGRIEALTLERQELRSFHVLEHGQWPLTRRAVDTCACRLEAPPTGVALDI